MNEGKKSKRIKTALKVLAIPLVAITLIIVVPIAINEAYNIVGYATQWGATEAFLYYGTIIGGMATMAAVFLSNRNSNKRIQEENDRRELERKKDFMRQRNDFIESVLFDIYENVDSTRIYSRINVADNYWKDRPMEFFKYYDEAQRTYGQFARFRHKEMKLCDEEFGELYIYLTDYMSVLWGIHILLGDYKKIKEKLDYVEQLEIQESLRWDAYRQGEAAVHQYVEGVLADKGLKPSGHLRGELSDKSKEIDEKYDGLKLLQERYSNLRIKIHDAIDKLEKQVEDVR